MLCLAGAIAGSVLAVVGSGVVERAIHSLADLGVSGSIVRITPVVIVYAVVGAVVLGFFAGALPGVAGGGDARPVEAIQRGN